ncbi:MAG: protein kinase domain-containing protein [Planctomycetota bacterium]
MKLDPVAHELICKVVYVGPGMSGKTSNLRFIREHAPSDAVGDMVSIDTDSERTLQFDLLPLDIGTVKGYRCRFQFYTVPGQSYYAAIRRSVIEGADGIVFVCDSRREAMDENIESMNDLYDHLRYHKLPDTLPTVIQYNKQDLPTALPVEQLNPLLNHRNLPCFKASVITGEGVLDTLKKVALMVVDGISDPGAIEPITHGAEPSPPAAAVEARPAEEPETWLLTCHNCESLLEVPHVNDGDLFTCGSCSAPLQVQDRDRGLTRKPRPQGPLPRPAAPPPPPQPTPSRPAPSLSQTPSSAVPMSDDAQHVAHDDSYAMQALPDSAPAALAGPDPTGANPLLGAASFPLGGYDQIAELDVSLLGKRYRVREHRSRQIHRALALSPASMRQPGYTPIFERSVQAASTYRHRNAVALVTVDRSLPESPILLCADCPEFEPLTHVLQRRSKLQAPQAMAIMRQLCLVLEDAARHNLTHGWLRPDVVLLNAEGHVMLDELGLAKPHAYIVRESLGSSAATEHYLAPEHMLSEIPVDTRTDMFMLGALLFRMITGQGMVTGYSAHEALHKVKASGARSLRSIDADISRGLDSFCSRLTAVERKDRFPDYRTLIEQLDAFGGGARHNTLKLTQGIPAGERRRTRTNTPLRNETLRRGKNFTGTATATRKTTTGNQRRSVSATPPGGRRTLRGPPGHTGHHTGHHTAHHHGPTRSRGAGPLLAVLIILGGVLIVGGYVIYNEVIKRPAPQPRAAADPTQAPESGTTTQTPSDQPPPPTPPDTPEPPGPIEDGRGAALIEQARQAHVAFASKPDDPERYRAAMDAIATALAAGVDDAGRRYLLSLRQDLVVRAPVDATDATDATDASVQPPTGTDPDAPTAPAEAVTRIEDLLAKQRFAQAEGLARDLVSDPQARERLIGRVDQAHQRAWQDLYGTVLDRNTSLEQARELLARPLDVWGYPEDRDKAQELLQSKQAIIASERAAEQTPPSGKGRRSDTGDDGGTAPGQRTAEGYLITAVRRDMQLDRLLYTGDRDRAETLVASVPADTPERQALAVKLRLWRDRVPALTEVFARRSPKLRVTPPLTGEHDRWDVIGVTANGLQIQNPQGAQMDLAWAKIVPQELGEVYSRAMTGEDITPRQHAVACVANLIAGRAGAADIHAAAAEKGGFEHGEALGTLIGMWRAREVVRVFAAACEAIERNDIPGLESIFRQLDQPLYRRSENTAALIARLEAALADLRAGRATGVRHRDQLEFDDPADLAAFPQLEGSWSVSQSSLRNLGDGEIARDDCGNARSLTVRLLAQAEQGAVTIDFRGTTLIIDLADQRYHLRNGGQRLEDQSFPFLPNILHTLHFAIEPDAGRLHLEINQADPVFIEPSKPTSRVAIQADGSARIQIEDLHIKRVAQRDAGAVPPGAQRQLEEVLGLEAFGKAYKDPASPAVVLPANPDGAPSGIALPFRANNSVGIKRFSLFAGQGTLLLGLCQLDGETIDGKRTTLPLPGPGTGPTHVTVAWPPGQTTYTMTIEQQGTDPQVITAQRPEQATHFVIQVRGHARIPMPPTLERP